MTLDVEILTNVGSALVEHDQECDQPVKAVMLNPGNHGLLGWDELYGLPVLSDPAVDPKRFKLVCGAGRAGTYEGQPVYWDPAGCPHVREP